MADAKPLAHTVKTVRKHYVDLNIPKAPADDEESVVLRDTNTLGTSQVVDLDLSVSAYHQLISALVDGLGKVTGQTLKCEVSVAGEASDAGVEPTPEELREVALVYPGPVVDIAELVRACFGFSVNESRRLLGARGVFLDGATVSRTDMLGEELDRKVLQVGERKVRLRIHIEKNR